VAIGDLMAARIAALGIPQSRIRTVHNWTDDLAITPAATHAPALRCEWNIAPDAFVLEYSGNLGRAHEYDTVLGAAERLHDRQDIVFLFVGGGHMLQQLTARVAAKALTNFRFVPYQPRDRLTESLSVGDAHWVSLRPEFEGLIVPSKVFGICAAGRPVVAVCAQDGELPRLLGPGEASIVVAPGDADALATAILELADDPLRGDAIGAAGRVLLERSYRKAGALLRWQALLEEIASDGDAALR
jgi:colanic acid biosynthesis glycosyl transferase WcaI